MNEQITHGGARPNAGRKPLASDSPTASRTITLTETDWNHVTDVGLGNASLGVRILVDRDRPKRQGQHRLHYVIMTLGEDKKPKRVGKIGFRSVMEALDYMANPSFPGDSSACWIAIKKRSAKA